MAAAAPLPIAVKMTPAPTRSATSSTAALLFCHVSPKKGQLDRARHIVDLIKECAHIEPHVWFRTKLIEWTGGTQARRP
jgi:hypothetical protein